MPLRSCAAFIIAILTIAGMVGCDSNSEVVDEADAIGGPVVDDGSTTVGLGGGEDSDFTDENLDGIRDDVNALIDEEFSISTPVRLVAEQLARGTQNLLGAITEAEAAGATEDMRMAIECAYDHVYPDLESDEDRASALISRIESATINTRERVETYLAANNLMGGEIIELRNPSFDECFQGGE